MNTQNEYFGQIEEANVGAFIAKHIIIRDYEQEGPLADLANKLLDVADLWDAESSVDDTELDHATNDVARLHRLLAEKGIRDHNLDRELSKLALALLRLRLILTDREGK